MTAEELPDKAIPKQDILALSTYYVMNELGDLEAHNDPTQAKLKALAITDDLLAYLRNTLYNTFDLRTASANDETTGT